MNTPLADKEILEPVARKLAAGCSLLSFDFDVQEMSNLSHYGLRGRKYCATFTCKVGADEESNNIEEQRYRVFLKVSPDEDIIREAANYQYLQSRGAPVPEMLACIQNKQGEWMLFLEYIKAEESKWPCDDLRCSDSRFQDFLSALAHVNALPVPNKTASSFSDMSACWPFALESSQMVLKSIWELAAEDRLGTDMAELCRQSRSKLTILQNLIEQLSRPICGMVQGLVLNDSGPWHTGRRIDTGELIFFDLASAAIGPRFLDVSLWLGAPDSVFDLGSGRTALCRHYLREYERRGGKPVSMELFRHEVTILWMAVTLKDLWWWRNEALNGPGDPRAIQTEAYHAYCCELLHRDVRGMLSLL